MAITKMFDPLSIPYFWAPQSYQAGITCSDSNLGTRGRLKEKNTGRNDRQPPENQVWTPWI